MLGGSTTFATSRRVEAAGEFGRDGLVESCAMNEQINPGRPLRSWILGIPISVVTMMTALRFLDELVRRKQGAYICVTDVSNVMLAQENHSHRKVLLGAAMIMPDGTPLSWISRLRGVRGIRRVCGPDFMREALDSSVSTKWRHFLLGGTEDVLKLLEARLSKQYPKAEIVGAYSPPFRPMTDQEDEALVEDILDSKVDILWVGLGCPKQEKWMADHRERLPGVVQIGVGAAFNFLSGVVVRAPIFMRKTGFEWLHRLLSEPRRLWRRYVILAPKFVFAAIFETVAGSYRGVD